MSLFRVTFNFYVKINSEVAEMLFIAETDRPIIQTDSDDYVFTLNKKKTRTLKKHISSLSSIVVIDHDGTSAGYITDHIKFR